MKVTIENDIITVDGAQVYPPVGDAPAVNTEQVINSNYGKLLFDLFDANRNVMEYEGIVGTIQRWFYGTLQKSAWCATSLCYFADKLGILERIGGKHDNVYDMMLACRNAASKGFGTFYTKDQLPATIPKYSICFWLWAGDHMDTGSSKHVGIAEYASNTDTIYCIGGNQSDKICTKEYKRANLYAIYYLSK